MAARILLRKQSICRMMNASKSARTTSTIGNLNNIKDDDNWRTELLATMRIFQNFISPEEEDSLFREVEPYMKRLRYEFSHWDDAIHGYRETERAKWNEENSKIIERVKAMAFPPGMPELGLVHVLDLAAEGKIKPHVDSVRFCGDIIAGISLLSDCVMRLTQVGNEKECRHDFFLPRRSLYIMSGVARHKYNHEVLGPEESIFNDKKINKTRRISIICRSAPDPQKNY
ncbi:alpha-ketoglutarate-dependent dioxygenase alkB homolog 7, mitochondrial isoform X2 [Cotesia typhae]|uniref:alpha-ketoglutarate-dependent dioxygenase alkB homolog 7, mitochondrial isoform X2 n=1 Tax=Cotesia typhae TaxID=2053667 RepID=UPI003D68757E